MRRKNSTGIAVFVRSLSEMHLPQIGGELGLLIAAARHVLMRRHYLPPRLEVARALALDSRPGGLAPFPSHLLVEPQAQEFHLHLLDLVGLRGRDGGKEPPCGVESAVGVVTREGLLVRPLVAMIAQLAQQTAFGGTERFAEDVIPGNPT